LLEGHRRRGNPRDLRALSPRGPRRRNPALLAIDLYNKAYQGGNRPVREVNRRYSGSCGENAWKAIEPTRSLLAAARKAGLPVIYTTRHAETDGVRSTHRRMGSCHQPITVMLDLMNPVGAGRRTIGGGWEAGLDEGRTRRHRLLDRAPSRRLLFQRRRLLDEAPSRRGSPVGIHVIGKASLGR
jgi:hypothetical protein